MENKNKKIVFTLLLACILPFFVFAANSTTTTTSKYPVIAGITISESSSAADIIVYFFNLGVAAGLFIAVIMVVMGGIEWLTSSGNPGKIESAKSRITNALLGVTVLLGAYLILNSINSSLSGVTITKLDCIDAIRVQSKNSAGKVQSACINQDTENIGYDILATEEWTMSSDSILQVYIYSEPYYKGTVTAVNYKGDISGAKSLRFVWKKIGIYLYNGTNFTTSIENDSSAPLYLSTSAAKLSDSKFDNVASSIKVVNPANDTGTANDVFYHAVVFDEDNFRGNCSLVLGEQIPSLGTYSSYYPTPIGENAASSVVIYKIYGDVTKNRGTVTLYSGLNCSEEAKKCELDYSRVSSQPVWTVAGKCPDFGTGDFVQSFKITGQLGLVLMTSPNPTGTQQSGTCQYWDINDITNGTCYSKVKGSSVYNDACWDGSLLCPRPRSFMIFPVD
jgi:hypothetical protein